MAQIKQGRYTELPKGYITYPYKPGEKNSMGLANVLLTERHDYRYLVEAGTTHIDEKRITKPLWDELQKQGCKVTRNRTASTMGRKYLTENKIPVEIRKIMRSSKLEAIRIRLTGQTEGDLLENMKKIKSALAEWQIKPTECVWSQGDWKQSEEEYNKKPIVNQEDILKEQARLKNIVADLQDKIGSIEKPHLKKSIHEDRQVMKGILH